MCYKSVNAAHLMTENFKPPVVTCLNTAIVTKGKNERFGKFCMMYEAVPSIDPMYPILYKLDDQSLFKTRSI